jgi:folylpolyglutamate synthase/dihydropteroate synthase
LYLIIALTHERQPRVLFKKLSQRAHEIIVTRFTNNSFKRCYEPNAFAKQLIGKHKKVFLDPHRALEYALTKAKSADAILITGSLYLTGQLRSNWRSEAKILKQRKS